MPIANDWHHELHEMRLGRLRLRVWNRGTEGERARQVDILWDEPYPLHSPHPVRGIGLRFGRPKWRNFSERYQGTNGIPRRFFYAFGGRITVVMHR